MIILGKLILSQFNTNLTLGLIYLSAINYFNNKVLQSVLLLFFGVGRN